MKKVRLLSLLLVVMLFAACGTTQTVPLTGRQHRIGVSDEEVLSLSNQEYTKYMQTAKKSTNAANTAMVERVGKRLANAVENYLRNNGYASEIKNYSWEFNLVQDKNVNAFCMPGGKIVVYEGLLPYTQTEDALAIVLGHEIAHAVAKHSAEQLTKQQNQQIGTNVLGNVLNATVGSNVGTIASTVAGQYFSFRNLKYSRDNESEADHMGLIFAAMAGYNPEVAIPFWKRMAGASSGAQNDALSNFFSDHPSDAKRIVALEKEMPEALKYYQAVKGTAKTSVSATKSTSKKSRR
ncbi:MAG: M48 family metalloprotease [Prevotella sp.]|jgi:predicted Zn-dependent protease|nr:M48 family metalloprotease [Prevotella sp.]MCI1281162.1 M48 family metalloprotease [Prevotella sp.]